MHSCLFNKLRHLLGCSVVIVCIVKMMAEVNRHHTVGDVSVRAKQVQVINTLEKLTHTHTKRQISTCLGLFPSVIGRACTVKSQACKTQHSAFWPFYHSTCMTTKQDHYLHTPILPLRIIRKVLGCLFYLQRWQFKKSWCVFRAGKKRKRNKLINSVLFALSHFKLHTSLTRT